MVAFQVETLMGRGRLPTTEKPAHLGHRNGLDGAGTATAPEVSDGQADQAEDKECQERFQNKSQSERRGGLSWSGHACVPTSWT